MLSDGFAILCAKVLIIFRIVNGFSDYFSEELMMSK